MNDILEVAIGNNILNIVKYSRRTPERYLTGYAPTLTQLCPWMMRNFNKLVCYYIWKLYYIRTSRIIWTFWIQILQ